MRIKIVHKIQDIYRIYKLSPRYRYKDGEYTKTEDNYQFFYGCNLESLQRMHYYHEINLEDLEKNGYTYVISYNRNILITKNKKYEEIFGI